MKILIVDTDCVALSFALRAAAAGHSVKWYIKPRESNNRTTGDGFKGIEKVENWIGHAKWADLIFCTSNDDFLPQLDRLRDQGFPVFAPTQASAKLEISRADGMHALEAAGIPIAPYITFKTMADAEKHVRRTEERYVFKTMGDNEDKALTYVSKSPADLIAWMRRTPPPKGEVMLQTFVKGIEMGVSRFMGKDGWVGPWNESFEHKKLMSGNYGPNTGEMGTVAYFTKESKLGVETLGKLETALRVLGHMGDVALGFIIDEKGKLWPTEWTCRFGWPIANMMLGATKGDPVQWMRDALDGRDTTSFSTDIGVCLVLAHGDFPYGNDHRSKTAGVPIYGVSKLNQKYIHPQSVRVDRLHDMQGSRVVERPMWATSGEYVAVVTGYGKNVVQASERAYGTAKELHIANMLLRDDVGEALKKQLPTLHRLGYATHCNFD